MTIEPKLGLLCKELLRRIESGELSKSIEQHSKNKDYKMEKDLIAGKYNRPTPDAVNSPAHYTHGGIEVIDYIEAKGFDTNWNLANVIKYVSRAGYKISKVEDLKKAQFYLSREIKKLESNADV